MKWGVRRYRNKDGTLTPAGKKRYDYGSKNYSNKRKDVQKLSDDELNKRIDRLKKEKEYINLSGETADQGKNYIRNVRRKSGPKVLDSLSSALISKGSQFVVGLLMSKITKATQAKANAELKSKLQNLMNSVNKMSDEELASKFERKKMEKAYINLFK